MSIAAQITEKIDQVKKEVEQNATTAVEAKIAEVTANLATKEDLASLEAKLSVGGAPAIQRRVGEKNIIVDVNARLIEQMSKLSTTEKTEVKLFEDDGEYQAYLRAENNVINGRVGVREASTLTGDGLGIGGTTDFLPQWVARRYMDPLRGVASEMATDSVTAQFRVKVGNAGWQMGTTVDQANTRGNNAFGIWQQNMKDATVRYDIRIPTLDDVEGGEANLMSDTLAELAQLQGYQWFRNNDQAGTGATLLLGGQDGPRGIDQYAAGADSAFGTFGTNSTNGLHTIRTIDQAITNGFGATSNLDFSDLDAMDYALPLQYDSPNAVYMGSRRFTQYIRGLKYSDGTSVFDRNATLRMPGQIGELFGRPYIQNPYMDPPNVQAGAAGTQSLYPLILADWKEFYKIFIRTSITLQRFTQTVPGSVTVYGETRFTGGVNNPFAGVRFRTTSTAGALPQPALGPGL